MASWIQRAIEYVRNDWSENPWRAAGETYNYVTSAVSSAVFAATVPAPPFLYLYPMWMSGLIVMIFCAISRGSTGILALCITMLAMDMTGYVRLLLGPHYP